MKNFLNQPVTATGGARPNFTSPSTQNIPRAKASKNFDITDIKQYFYIVVKRIWLVVLCFILAVLATVILLLQKDNVFKSRAVMEVSSSNLNLPGALGGGGGTPSAGYYAKQEEILRSQKIIAAAQERISRPSEEIRSNLRGISVRSDQRIGFITISVTSLDPILSSDLANAMAEEFIEYKSEQRIDESQSTVISLTQQANRLRDELRKVKEKRMAFERENNIVSVGRRRNQAAEFLSSLRSQESAFRMNRLMLEAQQPYLAEADDAVVLATLGTRFGSSALSGSDNTVTNPVSRVEVRSDTESLIDRGVVTTRNFGSLKRELSTLQAALNDSRTRLRDNHPKIIELQRNIKDVSKKIDLEVQAAQQSYYAELESLLIKENAVKLAAREYEREAVVVERKHQEHDLLIQDERRLQSLYDVVYARLKEIDISIGQAPETISVLETATPSKNPANQKQFVQILLAAGVGIGIGVVLVFGLEYLDDSLRYPEEVEDVLGLTFFGVIPSANWDPDDLNSHMLSNLDQKSGLAEAYRNVRSALIFSGILKPGVTIALTSAVPREGKTTTTLNLSVSLSQAGSRVLLVDADLRRGELHKFFGLEGGRGFSDLLAGNAKPEALIQRTGLPNLDLIATGPFPPNPAELLLTPEFTAFVEMARRSYDVILFDCPPVMAVSEAVIMASNADAVIFVVWAGQTSRKLSEMSVSNLRQRGANLVGCVLNNLEFGRVGYYYYSTYYGYYDYDYRYEARYQ